MDFDDQDTAKEVSKPRRFAPGRAGKPKPKPKPEPTADKPGPSLQTESASKIEHDVDASINDPKVESEVHNGPVKMEIDSKDDNEPQIMETDKEDQLPLPEEKKAEEKEEEDVVVREIDVYFNPSIGPNNKLYVVQYPLRPSWRPYELDERCEEFRVNPSTSQVEIDLSLDVNSNNYDSCSGINMTKQTLTTTWKPPPTSDYAIGVLSGDKLYLNPVDAVVQLRPSMEYLTPVSKKKQAESSEESAKTSKKQTKGVQATTDQKPNNEENWVAHKFHGLQSDYSSRYLKGMMAKGNSSLDFNMSPDTYIDELFKGSSRNSGPKVAPKRVLQPQSTEELYSLVKKLLCEGSQLLRYSVLQHYAPNFSDKDFLGALQEYGWLVQGFWTPKTELLEINEGPLRASRDYALCLFSKDTTIKFSQVEASGLLSNKMKTWLTVFAKERELLKDWKFKEATNVSFIKSYPEIVKEQDMFFSELQMKLESMINNQKAKSRGGNKRNVIANNPSVTVKREVTTHKNSL